MSEYEILIKSKVHTNFDHVIIKFFIHAVHHACIIIIIFQHLIQEIRMLMFSCHKFSHDISYYCFAVQKSKVI